MHLYNILKSAIYIDLWEFEYLNVKISDSGFFDVDETNLSSSVKGVFVAGAASGPKDTVYSMVQGSCAAAKVDILLRTSTHSTPSK